MITKEELKAVLAPYRREGDAALPNDKRKLVELYRYWVGVEERERVEYDLTDMMDDEIVC